MLAAISQGILLGLLLSILAGPMFFSLITLGLERGLRAGFALASGQWLSDVMFIFMTYLGVQQISNAVAFKFYMGIAGGIMLFVFGAYMAMTRPITPESNKNISAASYSGFFAKGFLINTINPFPIFFWMALAQTNMENGYSSGQFTVLYITVMLMVAVTDMGKVALAKSIRPWLKPNHLLVLRRVSGLALIVFGMVLIYRVW